MTNSIKKAEQETLRRRKVQLEYNKKHGIDPETIYKSRDEIMKTTSFADAKTVALEKSASDEISGVGCRYLYLNRLSGEKW